MANKFPLYGFPCVDDPNNFEPDAECCTKEEIATWEEAKRTYGTEAYKPNAGCETLTDEQGNCVGHVTRTSWGIGVNYIDEDEF